MSFRKWPRPLRLVIKGVVSLALLIGYPYVAANVAYTAYDIVTLDGCAKGWLQIQDDYKIAYDHTPETSDPMLMAGYLAETEHVLESRAEKLICPHSVQEEQADFLAYNRVFSSMLDVASHTGIPKDEANAQLFWFQISRAGRQAQAAQDTFTRAITAEWNSQHPQQ